eukprot:scaffold45504_cov70-Phaeocystis_antarctica.AAC.4
MSPSQTQEFVPGIAPGYAYGLSQLACRVRAGRPCIQTLLSTQRSTVPEHHRKLGAPEGCDEGDAGQQVREGEEGGV